VPEVAAAAGAHPSQALSPPRNSSAPLRAELAPAREPPADHARRPRQRKPRAEKSPVGEAASVLRHRTITPSRFPRLAGPRRRAQFVARWPRANAPPRARKIGAKSQPPSRAPIVPFTNRYRGMARER
jgi:hypothetical protein